METATGSPSRDALDSTTHVLAHCPIDDVRVEGRTIAISGWMMLPDGPPDAVLVRNAAGDLYDADRVERPDLRDGFPSFANAASAGFHAEVRGDAFRTSDDGFSITLLGIRDGAPVARRVVVLSPDRDDAPLPAEDRRVAAVGIPDERVYRAKGRMVSDDLRRAVGAHRDPAAVASLLHVDCGTGWLTRWFGVDFPSATIAGCDADPGAIEWMSANLQGDFRVSEAGRLPFDDASFDVVLAAASLDALDVEAQHDWMREAARVLRPSGTLVVAVRGPHVARLQLDAESRAALDRDGVCLGAAGSTFVTASFVRSEWTAGGALQPFESIEAGLDSAKDLHVLVRSLPGAAEGAEGA